jgi:hypothetical protein
MAHFAEINGDNTVLRVIVAEQDFIDTGLLGDPARWVQTSYNTKAGVYYDPETNLPHADQSKAFRKNFAGVGYTYDVERDAFIPPKKWASYNLDETTCQWVPPIPYPIVEDENGIRTQFRWNEVNQSWDPY